MSVFQLKDGSWGYRVIVRDRDGTSKNRRATRDKRGNKFKTKRSAVAAMNEVLRRFEEPDTKLIASEDVTVAYIYEDYCKYGRSDKAFATNVRHDSLWNNHIKEVFGDRYIKDISVAEINDYLSCLYYSDGYAYKYVESFLKFFYLLFGRAYTREYIDANEYAKICVDKGSKIRMPKLKIDEDLDIKAFSNAELEILDNYFKGTNVETLYMLGRYCGLRIGEVLGLTWDNIDFDNSVIRVKKQLQRQDGLIRIVPLKTRNAKRQVTMNSTLKNYILNVYKKRELDKVAYKEVRLQREYFIKSFDGNEISSLELVTTLSNGKNQTDSAIKFHSKVLKSKYGIEFRFHYLRHTFGTKMALLNVPQFLLCSQMGHSSRQVTGKYYLGKSEDSAEMLKKMMELL